jgi:hypothetical protein
MKKLYFSVCIVGLSITTISAQSIDEIVAKNLNALGGTEKLYAVKSVITENVIQLQRLAIENLTTVLVGKAMRSDSKIMGNNLVQAADGTTAWVITPVMMGGNGEAQLMSEEMAKSSISQIDPFPLLDYMKKGTRVELLAAEKLKGKDAYHLKIYPKNGTETEIWIDVVSGLMAKLKTLQNGQEVEVRFLNYQNIKGISFSTNMEISNPVAGIITVETKSVKLNTAIDKAIFKMPTTKN